MQSKTEHRRGKLLENLDDQLGMIQALIDGEVYTIMRRVWRTNENGVRVLVECPKRTRSRYWMSGVRGSCCQVQYGSKVLELKPGMTGVQVATKEELPKLICSVKEVVKFGELDIQIEDVAEKGTADLRFKGKSVPVKKAS